MDQFLFALANRSKLAEIYLVFGFQLWNPFLYNLVSTRKCFLPKCWWVLTEIWRRFDWISNTLRSFHLFSPTSMWQCAKVALISWCLWVLRHSTNTNMLYISVFICGNDHTASHFSSFIQDKVIHMWFIYWLSHDGTSHKRAPVAFPPQFLPPGVHPLKLKILCGIAMTMLKQLFNLF